MYFIRNLSIKTKLYIPIYFQVFILIAVIFFYFRVDALIQKSGDTSRAAITETSTKIRTMSFAIDDYLRGKKTLGELKTQYDRIFKLFEENKKLFIDTNKIDDFVSLDAHLREIDGIFIENNELERQIFELTDTSAGIAAGYTRNAGGKSFLDTALGIKILFLQSKEHPEKSAELSSHLDQMIKNAEADEARLASTALAESPRKVKKNAEDIKKFTTKYSGNVKKIDDIKKQIMSKFDGVLEYIRKIETEKVESLFGSIDGVFRNLLVIIGIVACFIIVLNTVLAKWITTPIKSLISCAHELAVGHLDMNKRISVDSKDEISELSRIFNQFLDRLHDMMINVKKKADLVSRSTAEISVDSQSLAERTFSQVSSISGTSQSVKQFASTIRNNTENSVEADMMLSEFNSEISEKSSLIKNVTSTMTEIYDSSKEIDNIIKVINDISFQTNLLALNAAVEAARAGEAGRGFAVVAAEVRNLAQKTAESSKSIQNIVARNVETTQKGMELVNDTSSFFNELVGVMNEIVEKIANITEVSREQAVDIDAINQSIIQMEKAGNEIAKLLDHLTKGTAAVKTNVEEFQQSVDEFKIDEASAQNITYCGGKNQNTSQKVKN